MRFHQTSEVDILGHRQSGGAGGNIQHLASANVAELAAVFYE
jgi:hypothetical protein